MVGKAGKRKEREVLDTLYLKQLDTLYPKPEKPREMKDAILSFSFSLEPQPPRTVLSTFKVGLPWSVKPLEHTLN